MLKIAVSIPVLFISFLSIAQTVPYETPSRAQVYHSAVTAPTSVSHLPENTIWSEDFSNGIPSNWTNEGYNAFGQVQANCFWEYRGVNTTPDTSEVSRGAYWGSGTIASPTVGNGFVVFDSDYLDNNGIAGNFGNGIAAGPNIGTLTTDTIDLSNHTDVELSFHTMLRTLGANNTFRKFFVAFSTDAGTTYPDTILIEPTLGSNTVFEGLVDYNVSNLIGGQDSVRIRFMFNALEPISLTGGLTAYGYYFMAIDDIKINEAPDYSVKFIPFNGAPAVDLIYGPAAGSSKMGHMVKNSQTDQTRDITFDANCYNNGANTLTNVRLGVDIYNSSNLLVNTFISDTIPTLQAGDTLTYNALNTYLNPWNANTNGNYRVVFSMISDSSLSVYEDTIPIAITQDYMSNDYGRFTNSLGTSSTGNDGSALASRIDFTQAADVESVWIGLGANTDVGGIVNVVVFDSAGFDFISGYPTTSLKYTSANYTISQADSIAGFIEIPINPSLQVLANTGYYFAVYMYSNGGLNPITIRNDQTTDQATMSAIMYFPSDFRWYSGFNNSKTLNALWIRPKLQGASGITTSGPTTFCEGQSVQLSAPPNLDSYLWNTGDTTSSIVADTSGIYSVTVTDNGSSTTLPSVTVTVISNPSDQITILEGASSFCVGDSLTLIADTTAGNTYQWYFNGNVISNAVYQMLVATVPGNYSVFVTNSSNCSTLSSDTLLSVLPVPTDSIYVAGNNSTICDGDSVLLAAAGGSAGIYQWLFNGNPLQGASQSQFYAKIAGTYSVQIQDSNACKGFSNQVTIATLPPVTTSAVFGPAVAVASQTYAYSVLQTTNHTYNWTVTNGMITSGQGTSMVDIAWNQVGNGNVEVVESNGSCTDTSSLQVNIVLSVQEEELGLSRVYPNPAQDYLTIEVNNLNKAISVEIYSITGQLLMQHDLTESISKINISGLAAGLYILKTKNNNSAGFQFTKN
jgi:hypothetical protein